MKKKILILIISVFLCPSYSMAQSQFAPLLTNIENSLFGVDFPNQNESERLDRIENNVYGKITSGSVGSRITKLKKDINADLIGSEIKPTEDTFREDDSVPVPKPLKEDSSVNYPIVDMLEEHVFKRTYKSMDITSRLSALEKKSFSQTYQNEDLNTRVNRLRTSLLPKKRNDFENTYTDPYLEDDIDNYLASQDNFPVTKSYFEEKKSYSGAAPISGNGDVITDMSQIPVLEKAILKKNYSKDSDEERLSRMENKMFSTQFDTDDSQVRIQRLASAHRANKTSKKYENNRFTQNMSTAIQIGAMILMVLACIL